MNNNLELIRQKCIETNPEIVVNKHAQLIHQDHTVTYFEQHRSIRLADVLLAIETVSKQKMSNNERNMAHIAVHLWNLRKDDLKEQSEETIDFLAELLR